jgi:hypothetical protein
MMDMQANFGPAQIILRYGHGDEFKYLKMQGRASLDLACSKNCQPGILQVGVICVHQAKVKQIQAAFGAFSAISSAFSAVLRSKWRQR